ncbi:MAG: MBG domain-containing protein, partial [Curvibacter sp.]
IEVGGKLDASAPNGGDGGFIETSAAEVNLHDGVRITTAAFNGSFGTWLLDPAVIEIVSAAGTPPAGTTQILATTLNTNLTTSNVDLQADKWIDFQVNFTYSGARDATLGLYAPTIKLGGDISSSSNKLNLNFGGTYSGTSYAGNLYVYDAARAITTKGGNIAFNGNIGGPKNLSINTGAGSVSYNTAITGTFNVLSTTTGNLSLTYTPGTNGATVIIDFTASTITADGATRTYTGVFPTGVVSFKAGTVVDLNAKNATSATLTLADGVTTQTIAVSSGKITIPAGGLIVSKIQYLVGSANAVTVTATDVTYDTSANAGKLNNFVLNTGALTLGSGKTIAVDGNIDLITSRFVNNAGASALSVGTGKYWRVWSTNADPFNASTGDVAGGLGYDFKQYNATYGSSAVLGTGNGLLYSYAPVLTVSLSGSVSKTYDGNATATLAAGNYSLSGAVDGDSVVYVKPTSGSYQTSGTDNANAGIRDVYVSGISVTSASKGAASVYGYQLSSATATGSGIGEITARPVTVTADNKTRVYGDANPSLTYSVAAGGANSGLVSGETLSGSVTTTAAQGSNVGT